MMPAAAMRSQLLSESRWPTSARILENYRSQEQTPGSSPENLASLVTRAAELTPENGELLTRRLPVALTPSRCHYSALGGSRSAVAASSGGSPAGARRNRATT